MAPKPTRPPGRPTALAAANHRIAQLERQLERAHALRAAAGGPVDPLGVLAEIARDIEAPPMARVSAARALLASSAAETVEEAGDDGIDALTARALRMGRNRHDDDR